MILNLVLGVIRELVQEEWNKRFEKRFQQLEAFKEEIGHCNVPNRFANNRTLGYWCSNMRRAYKNIQKGMKMKTDYDLTPDRIKRLEEIGFQWQGVDHNEAFEKRCRELIAFKEEIGHCNVPRRCANNPSLGQWCANMRYTFKNIQMGMKTKSNLSPDRIKRLEEIGFQW